MHPEHRRDVDGQRAVDIDRYLRNFLIPGEAMQAVDQLLNPADSECWDEHLAAARGSPPDGVRQAALRVLECLVLSVGVGGFHDERVDGAGWWLGVAHDGKPGPPNVPGEDQPLIAGLANTKIDAG